MPLSTVNDRRLQNFLKGWYKSDGSHYIELNLYREFDTVNYAMSWVISEYLLNAMKDRVNHHENIPVVLKLLH